MGKRSWDKGPKRPPKDPQTFRRRFCAAAEMKVSRYRRLRNEYLDLEDRLTKICEMFHDPNATEPALKTTILALYEIRRDFRILAKEKVESKGPDHALEYKKYIVATEELIECFIKGSWPLKPRSRRQLDVGVPPPANVLAEVSEKRRGRPPLENGLSNRLDELRNDAVKTAKTIKNPTVLVVARKLANQKAWSFASTTLAKKIRAEWWKD